MERKTFEVIGEGIIGQDTVFETPFGRKRLLYADWTASGRLYQPIEEKMAYKFGPFVANTHTETNVTGTRMTKSYEEAKTIIKKHVNAEDEDVLLFEGTGMTGALCKFQRLLGLTVHERYKERVLLSESERPVVFVTHMEHHSNQTTWEETLADVVIAPVNDQGDVCPEKLERVLREYQNRKLKIGSFTACSNVTGIETPYRELAKVMHAYDGYCFVDFAASAPYVEIDMNPEEKGAHLDAIFFSPHKFLGGPGSSGIVIFKRELYENEIPERAGGGTVHWTNPWGEKSFIVDPEEREDGGTPGFMQAIRAALAIRLKEQMGVSAIKEKDTRLLDGLFQRLQGIGGIKILEERKKERLPIVSFYSETVHHNLLVKLLNDVHGIQVRGGCSCAGTYGHYMLNIGQEQSRKITSEIDRQNHYVKPGWVRVSLHPTMGLEDVHYISDGIEDIVGRANQYEKLYRYDSRTNGFLHENEKDIAVNEWFTL
ncbi:aminotransferase class V-fold PLP-dependent enzyme (plasmid) [Pontibacillus sp. ALD_SL1]|uniref:aminotransferase class V-fold PLP-dependent enzyme n=1 Tax=Pontibacillus sp. ALD_SL1 TaxID=2777185 RepID=UPI001A96CF19|nr:aminotransferase class V-fold PLP-dependent enzyme [Pontibacillus sp. ALD_SL1]QST02146.1 aminotransferase class V-fold PLP-dependent enzyme [Pontibacillus sp. ALD_SL1]